MVISEDLWHSHYCRAFRTEAITTFFNILGLSWQGFEQTTFRMRGERSNLLRHRRGKFLVILGYKKS